MTALAFPKIKQITAKFVALMLLSIVAKALYVLIYTSFTILGVMFLLFLVTLAVGLLFDRSFAYRWSARTFIFAAIILPIGVISPFAAGDYYAVGQQPPTVVETLLWLVPVDIFLLFVACIFNLKMKSNETKA